MSAGKKKINENKEIMEKLNLIEEKIQFIEEIHGAINELREFTEEIREIVAIIVQQMDSLERKYNKALDNIEKFISMQEVPSVESSKTEKVVQVEKKEEPYVSTASTISSSQIVSHSVPEPIETTINLESLNSESPTAISILTELKSKITESLDAHLLSRTMENLRDRISELLPTYLPLLFEMGKWSKNLKSYPAGQTLNEADAIALKSDIDSWIQRIEKVLNRRK